MITVSIEVTQSPSEVFNCITQVEKYWSKDFAGNCKQLNDEFTIHHPNQHYSKQKLVEVIADKKMKWLVTESELHWLKNNKHEWTDTKIIFEITKANGKTILHFTHEGLSPEMECYALCNQGWKMIIKEWLFHLITYGEESPDMNKAAEIRSKLLDSIK